MNQDTNSDTKSYYSMFSDTSSSNTLPNYTTDPAYSYMPQNIANHSNTSIWNSSNNSWDR